MYLAALFSLVPAALLLVHPRLCSGPRHVEAAYGVDQVVEPGEKAGAVRRRHRRWPAGDRAALAKLVRQFAHRQGHCLRCQTPFNFTGAGWAHRTEYCCKECARQADLERRRQGYDHRIAVAPRLS